MANNIIEYRTITPTTIVPTTPEIQYLTVTYLVSEDNLTIPIVANPSGIKSIIIDGGKKQIWKIPESMIQTFTTPGEHTIQFILEDDTALTSGMFNNITSVVDIQFPESITTIPEGSLYNTHIKSLIIPEGVTWNHDYFPDLEHLEVYGTLPGGAFSGNSKLKTVIVGKTGVLQGGCLAGQKTLDKVYIDGQFTSGGNFSSTTYIKELVFGENFRGSNIGGNFGGAIIDSVIVNTTQEAFDIYQVGTGANPRKIEIHSKEVYNSNSSGSGTFCSYLSELIIGNEVRDLRLSANRWFLTGCTYLNRLKLGKSLKKLEWFIQGCPNLVEINIPSNITELGEKAFYEVGTNGSLSLTFNGPIELKSNSISCGATMATLDIPIGSKLYPYFINNTCPRCIIFHDGGECLQRDIDDIFVANPGLVTLIKYCGNKPIQNFPKGGSYFSGGYYVEFDSSVNKIEDNAFQSFNYLDTVIIPKTLDYIGKYAFQGCRYLKQIQIDNKKVGDYAFYDCQSSQLKLVDIKSEIIGKYAFAHSSTGYGGSADFIFSKNLREIQEGAFKNLSLGVGHPINIYNCKIIGKQAFYYVNYSANGNYWINGLWNVEEIGEEAFYGFSYGLGGPCVLTNIKSIGKKAFYNSKITSLVLGENLQELGEEAFEECRSLSGNLTIPNSIKVIPKKCFKSCNFTSLTLSEGLVTIDDNAFTQNYNSNFKVLIIPDTVTYIGNGTFSNCSSLQKVILPKNLTYLGENAFSSMNWFYNISEYTQAGSVLVKYPNPPETVEIAEGITQIGSEAFYSSSGTSINPKYITFPSTLLYINNTAFKGCIGITEVNLPEGVISVGENAFYNCSGMTQLTLPHSLTEIKYSTFYGCSSLTELVIPSGVQKIGDNAFQGCSGLLTLFISDTVNSIGSSIGYNVFSNCSSLETIIVDQNNNTYDSRNNCNAIIETNTDTLITGCKTTIIPDTVIRIGSNAFTGCTNLTSITIPNSVTAITSGTPYGSFTNCTNLLTVNLDSNPIVSKNYSLSSSNNNICGMFGSQVTTYTLGSNVTSVGKYAFAYGRFTQLNISDSVTSIDDEAFYSCTKLTSVNIPSSVTNIHYQAFRGCSGITSISVDSNNTIYDSRDNCNAIIETATNKLMLGCTNTFPLLSTITSIGSYAFNTCPGLTTVTIPNTITDISSSAFSECTELTTLIIDSNSFISKNHTYGIYDSFGNQFINCTLGNSVTKIGNNVFQRCSKLETMVVPSTVTQIGNQAFRYCSKLTSLTIQRTTPPTLGTNALQSTSANLVIYVPAESVDTYKAASGWSTYADKIQAIDNG